MRNGQAIGDLVQDNRVRTISDIGSYFHATVNGSGSHDQDVVLGQSHAFPVHGIEQGILAHRREWSCVLPFKLNSQEIQDIAARQDVIETVSDFDSQRFPVLGNQGRGPQTITWAPSFLSPQMFDLAVRL